MDKIKLQNLVEKIARDLLNGMEKSRKKVLFIFCDSTAHEPFHDQFIELKNHSIDHDLMFLDGETSAWLGVQQIQSTGASQILAADEYAKAPIELPKNYDAVIIPEIDLDNAGRIAAGLKGTVKAEIVFSALVLNKPVIIGEDSPGLKRADRRTLKTLHLPKAYQRRFEKYIAELKELGIGFCPLSQFHETLKNLFMTDRMDEEFVHTKLLTTDWLEKQKRQTVVVSPETIITPSAKDYLKDKGIKLVRRVVQ